VAQNGGALAGHALGGAGVAIEVLTGFVLAVFCSVFFLSSGDRIWTWVLAQVGGDSRRWDGAARAGWATFAGYTRGVVIIAATNAVLVCVALLILQVPLALPLALLTFFAAFIPLIGSPLALGVATLVALASRGPLIALSVLGLSVTSAVRCDFCVNHPQRSGPRHDRQTNRVRRIGSGSPWCRHRWRRGAGSIGGPVPGVG